MFWRALGVLHFSYLYVCMFLAGNILPLFSMLLIRPLSPGTHERLVCKLAEIVFGGITDWSEVVGGLKVIVTGDEMPGSGIIISNHVSFSDSVAIHIVARK